MVFSYFYNVLLPTLKLFYFFIREIKIYNQLKIDQLKHFGILLNFTTF